MRINSMKLTVIIILAVMITGTVVGLFYKEIPEGNREVMFMVLGSLITGFISAIVSLFKKE